MELYIDKDLIFLFAGNWIRVIPELTHIMGEQEINSGNDIRLRFLALCQVLKVRYFPTLDIWKAVK